MLPFYETHHSSIKIGRGNSLQFPMHIHREIEIYYLKEGNNTVNISGIEHTMSAGELAIAFPNEPHSYRGNSSGIHLSIIFDPDLCPDFSSFFRRYRPEFPYLKIQTTPADLKATLDMLYDIMAESQPDIRLLKGYLTIILFRIMEQLPMISERNFAKRDLTSKVVSYLMQNYKSSITLDSLANELSVSKYEISRIFSNQIKMGFNQYLNRIRLDQAVYQLTTTDHSVTDIAFSCGFESLRTFYRVFSDEYHCSPLRYRKQNIPDYLPENKSEE